MNADALKRLRELQAAADEATAHDYAPLYCYVPFVDMLADNADDLLKAAEQVPALVAALRKCRSLFITYGLHPKGDTIMAVDAALAAHPEENTTK